MAHSCVPLWKSTGGQDNYWHTKSYLFLCLSAFYVVQNTCEAVQAQVRVERHDMMMQTLRVRHARSSLLYLAPLHSAQAQQAPPQHSCLGSAVGAMMPPITWGARAATTYPSTRLGQARHASGGKGKKNASKAWLSRHVKDEYVQKAAQQDLRARSAFKLIQIQDKHSVIKPSHSVVDLGAAPGSWSEYVSRLQAPSRAGAQAWVQGADAGTEAGAGTETHTLVAVDLLSMEQVAGCAFVQGDFTASLTQRRVRSLLRDGHCDVLLSDMLENTSGTGADHYRSMDLCLQVRPPSPWVYRPLCVCVCVSLSLSLCLSLSLSLCLSLSLFLSLSITHTLTLTPTYSLSYVRAGARIFRRGAVAGGQHGAQVPAGRRRAGAGG